MFIMREQYTSYAKKMEQNDKEIEVQAKQYNTLLEERKKEKSKISTVKPKLRQLDADIY